MKIILMRMLTVLLLMLFNCIIKNMSNHDTLIHFCSCQSQFLTSIWCCEYVPSFASFVFVLHTYI